MTTFGETRLADGQIITLDAEIQQLQALLDSQSDLVRSCIFKYLLHGSEFSAKVSACIGGAIGMAGGALCAGIGIGLALYLSIVAPPLGLALVSNYYFKPVPSID